MALVTEQEAIPQWENERVYALNNGQSHAFEQSSAAETTTMSVAEVRRCLSVIRKSWEEVQLDGRNRPMYLCEPLNIHDMNLGEFSLRFVLSHHSKRVTKRDIKESV